MNDNRYDWNGFVPDRPEQNGDGSFNKGIDKEQKQDQAGYESEVYSEGNQAGYNFTAPKEEPESTRRESRENIQPVADSTENNFTSPKYETPQPEPQVNTSGSTGYNFTVPKDDPLAYHPVYQSYTAPSQYTPRDQNNLNYKDYANNYSAAGSYNQYNAQPETKDKKKKSRIGVKVAAIALVCALAGGAAGGAATYYVLDANNSSNSSSGTNAKNISIDESYNSSVEAVADKVIPSVVGIQATYTSSGSGFFGQPSESTAEGSGIVYSEDGYIITNYHVISSSMNSGTITVVLNENDTEGYKATVVGYDASSDLAVLKIDATGLTPIEIGNSDELQVGQAAIAVGNPGGLQFMNSVSQGIISGLNRTLTMESGETMGLIQTDAAINPGNSGGALVDGTGKLIGINSAKISGSDSSGSASYEGMGFAIPVNEAVEICNRLIANEGKKSAYLGVMIDQRYDASTLEQGGYPGGLVVYSVVENSPASAAGIRANDILVSMDGVELTTYDTLASELSQRSSGDTVTMEIYRSGETVKLQVTLGENNS